MIPATYPAATAVPRVMFTLYEFGRANSSGISNVGCDTTLDAVVAGRDSSVYRTLFAAVVLVLPLLMNSRITVATLVPAARTNMRRRYDPAAFVPLLVNTVVTVPVPSIAVFAAVTAVHHWIAGTAE